MSGAFCGSGSSLQEATARHTDGDMELPPSRDTADCSAARSAGRDYVFYPHFMERVINALAIEEALHYISLFAAKLLHYAGVLDNPYNRTLSALAADANVAGRPWGCYLCKLLHWFVERKHCEKTLNNEAMPIISCILGILWLLSAFSLLCGIVGWCGYVLL